MPDYVEIMDTTLRDGEQTRHVSFSPKEKLSIAKALLKDLRVDRIEVTSARVSVGELETLKSICDWAKSEGILEKIEVLSFVDKNQSADWVNEAGCKKINLLAKGSLKHCEGQLKKTKEEHFADTVETINYAKSLGIEANVYLEDWSNGMRDSKEYVLEFAKKLKEANINRLLLPDTLGVLEPKQVSEFINEVASVFPIERCDFHGHNDYGLATANSLAAVRAGVRGIHCTVNGLGERTGNTPIAEIIAVLKDKTDYSCGVDEKSLVSASRLVERIAGKPIPQNKPIVGEDVFTQTAGIHADGDAKGNLYVNPLFPERFGRKREYALGKLSGKASLEQNLKEMKIELSDEQKKLVLQKVVELGDKKETVTAEDLPFIISDVIERPSEDTIKIVECKINSSLNAKPVASLTLNFNGEEKSDSAEGNGGYDAFMNALDKIAETMDFSMPELVDYSVRIPPGGKTDALVETIILWRLNDWDFRTIGVDSDQVMAAVKATEKMLNLLLWKSHM